METAEKKEYPNEEEIALPDSSTYKVTNFDFPPSPRYEQVLRQLAADPYGEYLFCCKPASADREVHRLIEEGAGLGLWIELRRVSFRRGWFRRSEEEFFVHYNPTPNTKAAPLVMVRIGSCKPTTE